mgnify:CR=1 FL=1
MDKEIIDKFEPALSSAFSLLIADLTSKVILGITTKEKAINKLKILQNFLSQELDRVNGGIAIIQQLETIKGNTNVRN